MGTEAEVVVVDGDPLLAARAERRIAELEARWSRFRTGSDVSSLNRCAGSSVPVSAATITLVTHALEAARATEGRYDPSVGRSVAGHGYDRDFADVADAAVTLHPAPDVDGSWPAIEVDPIAGTVCLPEGMCFDPGGIGKGLAADLVAVELGGDAAGLLINLGGDLRAVGTAPDPTAGWVVSIEDPFAAGTEAARLSIPAGAVATSSRVKRAWHTATGPAHHIIDPSTGRPAETDVITATVIAGDAWWAEALATSLMLQGPDGLASCQGAEAMLITQDGAHHPTPGLLAVVGADAVPR